MTVDESRAQPVATARVAPERVRDPAFDGLRAVAALAVLVTHVCYQTGYSLTGRLGGIASRLEVGVAVFFVLSSFLLARPFVAWLLDGQARPSVLTYLRHRAVRILPAYWVTIVGVAVLVGPEGLDTPEDWAWQLLLVQNYELNRLVIGATQMWSLSTEVAFYLVLPLLAGGAAVLLRRVPPQARERALLAGLGALATVSLVWPAAYLAGPFDPLVAPLWLPQFMLWFAAGMALAVIARPAARHRSVVLREVASAPWACWLLAAAALWLASSPLTGPRDLIARTYVEEVARVAVYGVVAVGLMMPLVARSVTDPGTVAGRGPARLLSGRVMRYLGAISFPLFLVQLVALELTYAWLGWDRFSGGTPTVMAVAAALTLVMAAALHRFVEAPLMNRLRGSTGPRRHLSQPAS